jgi:hypothetical protein
LDALDGFLLVWFGLVCGGLSLVGICICVWLLMGEFEFCCVFDVVWVNNISMSGGK